MVAHVYALSYFYFFGLSEQLFAETKEALLDHS